MSNLLKSVVASVAMFALLSANGCGGRGVNLPGPDATPSLAELGLSDNPDEWPAVIEARSEGRSVIIVEPGQSVQGAIDGAGRLTTVVIAPGKYWGFNLHQCGTIITSADPTSKDVVKETILMPQRGDIALPAIYLGSGSASRLPSMRVMLIGLRIFGDAGGGVQMGTKTDPILLGCQVAAMEGEDHRPAIYGDYAFPRIVGSVVTTATFGRGRPEICESRVNGEWIVGDNSHIGAPREPEA